MTRFVKSISLGAALCLAASLPQAALAQQEMPPEESMSAIEVEPLGRDELWEYRALDSYSQAPFLDALVESGELPAVAERLPDEPLVFKEAAMTDGIGEYGGVFRHVIGGRPEGWNWMAGQAQGYGGINMTVQECLVRNGPLWQVRAEEQSAPLPNLARDWEWNDERTQLTIHLVEGANWSDGDPFDAEDVRFWWEDNVQDTNVTARMPTDGMGAGTTLDVVDDYTITFNFQQAQGPSRLQALAFHQGCPGPSHILKPQHPRYSDEATYDSYRNAQPADQMPVVTMGAYAPVVHRPDEIIIMRRNPYYWKVDEAGNQLPYMNEMHFKLSNWADRTTQAVAGTGDFSNMQDPGNYVAALRQSQSEDAPTEARFGPRTLSWEIEFNLSEDVGVQDEIDAQLRELFREKDFRIAISHSLDRDAIGQSVARGPFSYPFPGGFVVGSPFYDREATVYYAYDPEKAASMLDELGLEDTDGDGLRNLPEGGANLEISMVYDNGEAVDKKQADAVTSMLAEQGIRIRPRPVDDAGLVSDGGNFNLMLRRNPLVIPGRGTCEFVPISGTCPDWHQTGQDQERNLFEFETEMADAADVILGSWDRQEALDAAKTLQSNWTENAYTVGLIQVPAALLINKRIRNAHPGTPVFLFEWAEDNVIRERLWTPAAEQVDELLPDTVPQYD